MDIKAFLVNTAIIEIGGIAPIGELSTHVRTYSKSMQDYQLPLSTDLSLTVFNDVGISNEQLIMLDKVSSAMIRETSQVTTGYDETQLIRAITANIEIINLRVGPLTEHGVHKGVSYMKFEILRTNTTNDNVILYYSDAAVRSEFDEVTYSVIPPAPIAAMEQPHHALLAINPPDPVAAIVAITADTPHTNVHRIDVVIHATDDQTLTVTLPFYVVAWGPHSGVDYKIRAAIIEYILSETLNDSAWTNLIAPELWVSNRFWLYPKWHDMATSSEAGIYSSVLDISDTIGRIVDAGLFDEEYILEHLETFTVSYKNLKVAAISSPQNTVTNTALINIIPDYLPTIDNNMFSAQSDTTKAWSVMIHDLVRVAEGMHQASDVGTDIIHSTNGAVEYYTASTGGITYSMARR